jgi:hypothetical protein
MMKEATYNDLLLTGIRRSWGHAHELIGLRRVSEKRRVIHLGLVGGWLAAVRLRSDSTLALIQGRETNKASKDDVGF